MQKLNLQETAWFKDYFKVSCVFYQKWFAQKSFVSHWFQGLLELEDRAGESAKWVKQSLESLKTLVQIFRKHG